MHHAKVGSGHWVGEMSETYEPEWLVENMILKNGLNFLVGPPKARKSTLRRFLVACLLEGRPVWEFATQKVPNILLLVGESALEAEAALSHRTLKGLGLKKADYGRRLYIEKPLGFDLLDPVDLTDLCEFVDVREFGLVILDPLVNFHKGEENDAADMGKVTRHLLTLAEHTTVLVIHHTAKPSETDAQKTVGQMSRGSSVLAGSADVSLLLRKRGGSDKGQLLFETRHALEPEPLDLWFDGASGLWLPADKAPTLEGRVKEVLTEDPKISGNALATKLHARRSEVFKVLKQVRGA